ncbi:hypothetical protein ACFSN5_02820 [Streptococcus tangpeifui]|uniref:hypothetical protein n=1 Tax=Streptococcus tangpeifui TaxID=2709400 RepID=UPI0013EBB492|nr:hypothetical protein [Streptococcus sp. ZJ1593]
MLTSYRDGQIDDIKNRMYTYLTVVRNWSLLFLLLFVVSVIYWLLNPKNIMGAAFSLVSFLPLLALAVQYVRENNIYRRDALKILTEDLALDKYEEVLSYESQVALKTNWDRTIIRQAELAFLRGNFNKSAEFIEMVNPVKAQLSPKERTPLLLTYYVVDFANKAFSKKDYDLEANLEAIHNLVVQNDMEQVQKRYSQQLLSLIEAVVGKGEALEDPEDIQASNKLEEVLRDYFLAENARLAGDKALAKKLFKLVSQAESSLFVVEKAKGSLKKMK